VVLAEGSEDCFQLGRQWRFDADEMAVRGRRQLEAPGMEEEAPESFGPAPRPACAIHRIAGDRVADGLQVDADLVRPSRHEVELQERPAGEALPDPIAGNRGPAVGHNRHASAVPWVPTDRRLDPSDRGCHAAPDQREVGLLHSSGLELAHQRCLRGIVAGHHEQAARVPVQAVDDARTSNARDSSPRLGAAPTE